MMNVNNGRVVMSVLLGARAVVAWDPTGGAPRIEETTTKFVCLRRISRGKPSDGRSIPLLLHLNGTNHAGRCNYALRWFHLTLEECHCATEPDWPKRLFHTPSDGTRWRMKSASLNKRRPTDDVLVSAVGRAVEMRMRHGTVMNGKYFECFPVISISSNCSISRASRKRSDRVCAVCVCVYMC